ncbi:MAG: 16S rRNA (guanine(966)-N(2))-methyltransferase RsmD [Luteitalea sp.]
MRIVAGAWGGRGLQGPTWNGLRPTSDRLRETLFNVLAARLPGARLLDLCAGTGAVGLEALSRGAAHVTFVDDDPRAVALIRANLLKCGVPEGYTIERRDARAASAPAAGVFDIVFLDPPYAQRSLDPWLETAARSFATCGVVVLEHARRVTAPEQVSGLTCTRRLPQGDSALAFYQRADPVPEPR